MCVGVPCPLCIVDYLLKKIDRLSNSAEEK